MIVRVAWYRTTQFLTVSFIAAGIAVMLHLEETTLINQLCALVTSSFMMWGIFYFIQLIPRMGHYVIIIQSMIGDMVHFQLLFWLMFFPFPLTFYMVLHSGLDCSGSTDFSNMVSIVHDSFLILLNSFDISFYMGQVDTPWLLAAIHVLFVLICAIMMLNFLIALLSNSVAKISCYSDIILPLQSLAVVFTLEGRCYKLLRKYYARTLASCKHFVCKEGKIFLQTVESIYDSENEIAAEITGKDTNLQHK